jgi:Asp/Glu/hydantoin racemase
METWEAGDGQELVRYLDRVKGPTTAVETVAITLGPASIEAFYDEAMALPGILYAAEEHGAHCDAVVIHCFADPGIVAMRQILEDSRDPGRTRSAARTQRLVRAARQDEVH